MSRPGAEIILPETCTIIEAASLHSRLCEILENDVPITLDAGRVETVDTAILQMFWILRKQAGAKLHWLNVGEYLRQSAAQLGMEALFDGS